MILRIFSDWETLKHGIPQEWILRPLLSTMYINDLFPRKNTLWEPIIFDDPSAIIYSQNVDNFSSVSNMVLSHMSKLDITNNSPLSTDYNEKYIEVSVNIRFLGLQIDNHLNWKNHIDQVIPKLCAACIPSQTSLVFGFMCLQLLCPHLLGKIWMMVWDDFEVNLLQNMETPIRIY